VINVICASEHLEFEFGHVIAFFLKLLVSLNNPDMEGNSAVAVIAVNAMIPAVAMRNSLLFFMIHSRYYGSLISV
jgi:hypothetical protein